MLFNQPQLLEKNTFTNCRGGMAEKYSGETGRLSKRLKHSTATKVPCGENIF